MDHVLFSERLFGYGFTVIITQRNKCSESSMPYALFAIKNQKRIEVMDLGFTRPTQFQVLYIYDANDVRMRCYCPFILFYLCTHR